MQPTQVRSLLHHVGSSKIVAATLQHFNKSCRQGVGITVVRVTKARRMFAYQWSRRWHAHWNGTWRSSATHRQYGSAWESPNLCRGVGAAAASLSPGGW